MRAVQCYLIEKTVVTIWNHVGALYSCNSSKQIFKHANFAFDIGSKSAQLPQKLYSIQNLQEISFNFIFIFQNGILYKLHVYTAWLIVFFQL